MLGQDLMDLTLLMKTKKKNFSCYIHISLLHEWTQNIACVAFPSVLALLILQCSFKFTEPSDADQETALAGARGFLGCLSAVQFSHVAPLKAALHPSRSALITVSGHVTESSCMAQAGTDATSKERTHSFAGGLWVFLYLVTKTVWLLDLKSSDVTVILHSQNGFLKWVWFV